jgi:hypothetical protein
MVCCITLVSDFWNIVQELFQGPRYKIEQLEDEDGQMTVHQLTIGKPMHKVKNLSIQG